MTFSGKRHLAAYLSIVVIGGVIVGIVNYYVFAVWLAKPASAESDGVSRGLTGFAASSAGPSYVKWEDPNEGAFTVEIPQGWKASGGLARTGKIDIRPSVELESPDGAIRVFFGDPNIGMYQVPNEWLQEGTVIAAGPSTATIMHYEPGGEFAARYLATICPGAVESSPNEIPDAGLALEKSVKDANAGEGPGEVQANVAEIAFVCGDRMGLIRAGTELTQPPPGTAGVSIWSAPLLSGYFASDADHARTAWMAMEHVLATFAYDRDWEGGYRRQVYEVTGQAVNDMNTSLSRTIERAQAAEEVVFHRTTAGSGTNAGASHDANDYDPAWSGIMRACTEDGITCKAVSTDRSCYWESNDGSIRWGSEAGEPPDHSGQWHSMGC